MTDDVHALSFVYKKERQVGLFDDRLQYDDVQADDDQLQAEAEFLAHKAVQEIGDAVRVSGLAYINKLLEDVGLHLEVKARHVQRKPACEVRTPF